MSRSVVDRVSVVTELIAFDADDDDDGPAYRLLEQAYQRGDKLEAIRRRLAQGESVLVRIKGDISQLISAETVAQERLTRSTLDVTQFIGLDRRVSKSKLHMGNLGVATIKWLCDGEWDHEDDDQHLKQTTPPCHDRDDRAARRIAEFVRNKALLFLSSGELRSNQTKVVGHARITTHEITSGAQWLRFFDSATLRQPDIISMMAEVDVRLDYKSDAAVRNTNSNMLLWRRLLIDGQLPIEVLREQLSGKARLSLLFIRLVVCLLYAPGGQKALAGGAFDLTRASEDVAYLRKIVTLLEVASHPQWNPKRVPVSDILQRPAANGTLYDRFDSNLRLQFYYQGDQHSHSERQRFWQNAIRE